MRKPTKIFSWKCIGFLRIHSYNIVDSFIPIQCIRFGGSNECFFFVSCMRHPLYTPSIICIYLSLQNTYTVSIATLHQTCSDSSMCRSFLLLFVCLNAKCVYISSEPAMYILCIYIYIYKTMCVCMCLYVVVFFWPGVQHATAFLTLRKTFTVKQFS